MYRRRALKLLVCCFEPLSPPIESSDCVLCKSHHVYGVHLQINAAFNRRTEDEPCAADKRHHERTILGLEAQSSDLSRQVQLLLHEVTELKGGATTTRPRASDGGGAMGVDAAAVITSRLVDFRDISELQEQNRSQLEVIRKLSADQEDMGSRLKAEYQSQVEKIQSEAQKALDELESRKGKTQTMVEAIMRQRDMYKSLYASSTSGPGGVADADAAALSLAAAASASLAKSGPGGMGGAGVGGVGAMMQLGAGGAGGMAMGGGSQSQLTALNVELQPDLAKHKEESAANADLLRKQADEHRSAAAAAKAEAAAANAQAEFERSRYNSLAESAATARRDVEQLVEKNAALSRQLANHEAALREQSARLEAGVTVHSSTHPSTYPLIRLFPLCRPTLKKRGTLPAVYIIYIT